MRFLTILFLALALFVPDPARAAAPEARAVAERLVNEAHAALADPAMAEPARNAQLRSVIADTFAFDVWERFILGDRAGQFDQAQLAEFRSLLPGYVANLYRRQFGRGLEAKPEIEDVRQIRRDFLVRARIPRAEGDPLPVDWRIRDFGGRGHLVADVMLGGVSFLVLKRDEFTSILDRQGVEGLLDVMRRNAI